MAGLGLTFALIAILSFAHESAAAGIKELCYTDDDCIQNAACRPHSCDMFVCQCKMGYHEFVSMKGTCSKASLIGESCSPSSTCLPVNSFCDIISGKCACKTGFTSSRDGFKCNDNSFKGQPELGVSCSSSTDCDYFAECVNNVCQCKPGYSNWTLEEKWLLYPRPNFLSCKTANLAIDMCNGVKITRPLTPHHQQPPDQLASTTSTETPSTTDNKPVTQDNPPSPHAVPRFQ